MSADGFLLGIAGALAPESPIRDHRAMAGTDTIRGPGETPERKQDPRAVGTDISGPATAEDAAKWARRVVADQVAAALEAVEAVAEEIRSRAHREVQLVRRQTHRATGGSVERLDAMSRELEALAAELDRRVERRAERRANDR